MAPLQPPPIKSEIPASVSRRQLLGGLAAGITGAASGCLQEVESTMARESPEQLSLAIKTVPADTDQRSVHIARYLAEQLEQVGIAPTVIPMNRESLRRDVLLNHQFDLYVDRFPARSEPDFLRGLVHSRFGPEPGWQNPFGYADLDTDDLLVAQRRQDVDQRTTTLWNLQSSIVNNQPFSVVAFPHEMRVHRTDRVRGWDESAIHSTLGYLSLSAVEGHEPDATTATASAAEPTSTGEQAAVFTVGTTDERMTRNLNPISVAFRDGGTVTGLLYDRLGRWVDGEVQPWLASGWEWLDTGDVGRTAEVEVRPDATWHDGRSITAEDLEFTYEFLADTSLGAFESPTPAPRFRDRGSLVRGIKPVDRRTIRLEFVPCNRQVARRAFAVPVFPRHVWKRRTDPVDPPWLASEKPLSEALVWRNPNPVGSGPFEFHDWKADSHLTLRPFDDHFLNGTERPDHLSAYRSAPVDRLRFEVVPTSRTAVTLVLDGNLDATADPVMPGDVPATLPDSVERAESNPAAFYHVGYNTRRAPLSNPRFRRAVAQLLDKEYLVDAVFDGFASPAASPLARSDALAPRLQWHGRDPELPYPGKDGELNVGRARRAFRQAGYRYDDNGKLLAGNP